VDFFNHRRLHGETGMVPPAEFEEMHNQRLSAGAGDQLLAAAQ